MPEWIDNKINGEFMPANEFNNFLTITLKKWQQYVNPKCLYRNLDIHTQQEKIIIIAYKLKTSESNISDLTPNQYITQITGHNSNRKQLHLNKEIPVNIIKKNQHHKSWYWTYSNKLENLCCKSLKNEAINKIKETFTNLDKSEIIFQT